MHGLHPVSGPLPPLQNAAARARGVIASAIRAVAVAALVLAPFTLDLAMAAKRPASEKPLVGSPQIVKDPHWGDVLFYFYQGDYLQALTRLSASQQFERL